MIGVYTHKKGGEYIVLGEGIVTSISGLESDGLKYEELGVGYTTKTQEEYTVYISNKGKYLVVTEKETKQEDIIVYIGEEKKLNILTKTKFKEDFKKDKGGIYGK